LASFLSEIWGILTIFICSTNTCTASQAWERGSLNCPALSCKRNTNISPSSTKGKGSAEKKGAGSGILASMGAAIFSAHITTIDIQINSFL